MTAPPLPVASKAVNGSRVIRVDPTEVVLRIAVGVPDGTTLEEMGPATKELLANVEVRAKEKWGQGTVVTGQMVCESGVWELEVHARKLS